MNCHPTDWLRVLEKDFSPEYYESYPEELPEETAYAIEEFIKCGCNILIASDIPQQIWQHQFLDQIEIESLLLPSNAFYLYFGKEAGFVVPDTTRPSEGALELVIVPEFNGQDEAPFTYSFMFEHFSNKHGFVQENLSTTAKEHLDRRFDNHWENMGKFNFRRMNNVTRFNPPLSYEKMVAEWQPQPKDILWKELSEACVLAALNLSVYFHAISFRNVSIKAYYPHTP